MGRVAMLIRVIIPVWRPEWRDRKSAEAFRVLKAHFPKVKAEEGRIFIIARAIGCHRPSIA